MQGLEVRICDDTQEGDLKRSEKQDMSLDFLKKKKAQRITKKTQNIREPDWYDHRAGRKIWQRVGGRAGV